VLGGDVTGHGVQEDHRDELVVGQPVAVRGALDHRADHVVGRVLALQLDDPVAVLDHVLRGVLDHLGRVAGADQLDRPLLESLAVLERDAEDVADDHDRQRLGVLGDQVDVVPALELGQVVVDELLDPRPERLHPAQREGLADQRAQPGVPGRVAVQHVLGQLVVEAHVGLLVLDVRPGVAGEHLVHPPAVLAHPRVLEQRADVGVPGDEPDVGAVREDHVMHTAGLAVRLEDLVRPLHEVVRDPVEGLRRFGCHGSDPPGLQACRQGRTCAPLRVAVTSSEAAPGLL
jgi:hypothetical protein